MALPIFDADFGEAESLILTDMQYMNLRFRQIVAEAIATERERCAQIAEHLNGWGDKAARDSGVAEHIAKVIRKAA